MSDDKPWEDYQDPIGQKTAPAPPQLSYGDYAEDIAKGAAGGLGRGVAGLVGAPGTVGDLVRAGLSKAGVSDETLNRGAQAVRVLGRAIPAFGLLAGAPDASQVQQKIESYTGKFYEPKTLPGQYASTIAEFAPAAALPIGEAGLAAKALNTVVPAVASESAGQLTKGTAAEPWARGIAGLAAGPLAAKAITPAAAPTAARAALNATLDRAGIPLTAGESTGSPTLRWIESNAADMPFSAGRAAELKAQQADAFDRAVTSRLFDRNELTARGVPQDVNLPDPRVVRAGRQSLSDEYDRLSQNYDLQSDPQLHRDLLAAQTNYERNVLPSQRAGGARDIEQIRDEVIDKLLAGQGAMPGDEYQALRSRLGTLSKGAQGSDPYLAGGLRDIRGALDRAMQRSLPPNEAIAWALNNRRYGNMKQIEGAIARGGENLSPQAVAQTARAGRAGQYAAQSGDLDELAKAASTVLKQPPNSGTAARLGWQTLFNLPTLLASGGGGVAGSLVGGPLGAAVGVAAPHLLPRLALSRAGQAYLGNQVLPQNARDIITQALMQQAISQPDVITRNAQARADYQQQRKQQRIQQGLPE